MESASLHDFDQGDMYCMYLFPGNLQSSKVGIKYLLCRSTCYMFFYLFQLFSLLVLLNLQVFGKDIVFVVDISGSMQGKLIDDIKNALSTALPKLHPDDSFSIIAFNGECYLFSTSMELASKDTVERAIEWIKMNFVAGGATNILNPLNKVHLNFYTVSSKPFI